MLSHAPNALPLPNHNTSLSFKFQFSSHLLQEAFPNFLLHVKLRVIVLPKSTNVS